MHHLGKYRRAVFSFRDTLSDVFKSPSLKKLYLVSSPPLHRFCRQALMAVYVLAIFCVDSALLNSHFTPPQKDSAYGTK